MVRVAIYARYSSAMQSDASIEDQIRVCTQRAEQQGWQVVKPYSDHAISGASMIRSGLQVMMQDGAAGKFDIVLTEGLDRLSRDQENIAGIYKRLNFAGVKIFTLADGEITDLHIGLKGTMNALFLKDLAAKTHRGIRGRVEKGKSGGGLSYGYDVVKKFDASGEPVRGERTINQEQAIIINRIFEEYAAGKSPKKIAWALNKENAPNPSGKGWSASTINGTRKRGSGIINNPLYIGQLIWNRESYFKNPDTGKRVARLNPKEEWVISDVPELRIVTQELWDKVRAKQVALSLKSTPHEKRRPKHLFSYLIKCGCCGGGFSKISALRYGCTTARNKGTCDNRITMAQDKLENTILSALQTHLMQPELVAEFCAEYTRHSNQIRKQGNTDITQAKSKLEKLSTEKNKLIEAIKQGIPACEVKDALANISEQRENLEALLCTTKQSPILLHPNMALRYHEQVTNLRDSLNQKNKRHEAAELIRKLVDKIVLLPDENNKKLKLNLHGDLAGILSVATGQQQGKALTLAMQNALPFNEFAGLNKKQGMNTAGAGRGSFALLDTKIPILSLLNTSVITSTFVTL